MRSWMICLNLFIASCACWRPETRDTPACVVLHQLIDCTKDAALSNLGPAVSGIIAGFVNGQASVDWDALLVRLEAMGIKGGGCIISQLENDFITKPQASPEHVLKTKAVSDVLVKFKQHFKIPDVKFCFLPKGATTQVCR